MKAFTMVELMVVVGITAIMAVAGSMVLTKTLGSRSFNLADSNITSLGMQTLLAIEKSVKYQRIVSVTNSATATTYTRSNCEASGSVTGDTLNTEDRYGASTYVVSNSIISSQSASRTPASINVSNSDFIVSNLSFTWYCNPSANDLLKISFSATTANVSGSFWNRTFAREVNMYNSFR